MKHKTTHKAKPAAAKRSGKPARKAPARARTDAADAVDAMIVANAQALGLTLDPTWHAGIAFNLRLILRLGALVDEFGLADDAEPAPIFHA